MIRTVLGFVLLLITCTVSSQDVARWKAVDMARYIESKSAAKVKVINMWATFCKPCIEEIPGFIEVTKKLGEEVELMLISVDMKSHYPEKIRNFSKAHKFFTPMAWLDETNADYFCPLLDKSWTGSIPATLIINTSSGYRKFFEEEMSSTQLEEEIKIALER